MYKVKNVSRCLTILGLMPGKTKTIENINQNICKMQYEGLISINKIIDKSPPLSSKEENTNIKDDNTKKEEVS